MDTPHVGELQEPRARAFLAMLAWAEGTTRGGRYPYSVTYGYRHTIQDYSDHPAATGEWHGIVLPARYCKAAGFRVGCRSTAAGAYQINLPTWRDKALRARYTPFGFYPSEQDMFAWVALVGSCGAVSAVLYGSIETAISLCSGRWASLAGSQSEQPQRSLDALLETYEEALARVG